jgi:hypothetical protein
MLRRIPAGLLLLLAALLGLVAACRRPAPATKVKLAAAGLTSTCTLDESGKVSCFGPTYPLARVPAPGTQFTSLAADGHDACGLLALLREVLVRSGPSLAPFPLPAPRRAHKTASLVPRVVARETGNSLRAEPPRPADFPQ